MMIEANAAITRLEKFSGFERDSNPPPLHYRCNALPTELLKHTGEQSCVGWPFMFSGRNTQLKYTSSMVIDVQQLQRNVDKNDRCGCNLLVML